MMKITAISLTLKYPPRRLHCIEQMIITAKMMHRMTPLSGANPPIHPTCGRVVN